MYTRKSKDTVKKRSATFWLTEEQLAELEPVREFMENDYREAGGICIVVAQIELHDNIYLDQKRGRVQCSYFGQLAAELISNAVAMSTREAAQDD